MLGFFRRRIEAFREALVADMAASLGSKMEEMEARLESIDEQQRGMLRQSRRGQQALEALIEGQAACGKALHRLESSAPPMQDMLVFVESFVLAMLAAPPGEECRVLRSKLEAMLAHYDIEVLDVVGMLFDAEKHEACGALCREDLPDGVVAQIVRPGFLQGGAVLRPAVVMVNRRPSAGWEEE